MFATNRRQHLMSLRSLLPGRSPIVVPIAPAAGIVAAGLVAIAFLLMPIVVIEDMAMDSGVAALLTAAAPPFGLTARLAVAFFAALAAGGITWFGLFLILGARTVLLNRAAPEDGVPVLRRADAHPDAPPRRPVFANRDLGTPFLDVKAEPIVETEESVIEPHFVVEACDVPADLDTPIAAYRTPDDAPLPDPEPAPAPVLTPVSAPRFAPHERIETFGLASDEPSAPLPQATIHDLLERLERGVAKRQPEPAVDAEPAREQTLEETLDALRALARRVG